MKPTKERIESAYRATLAYADYAGINPNFTSEVFSELLKGLRVLCDDFGLDFDCCSTLPSIEPDVILAIISNDDNGTYIDDVKIDDSIFECERVNWKLLDREDFIEELIVWIAEAKSSDKTLMMANLRKLLSWEDQFIWSSILTNDYISPSAQPLRFNEVCEEVLGKQKSLG